MMPKLPEEIDSLECSSETIRDGKVHDYSEIDREGFQDTYDKQLLKVLRIMSDEIAQLRKDISALRVRWPGDNWKT